jgi:hypothetical protein
LANIGTKIELDVDIGMAPLFLLFDADVRELRESFKSVPFAELGIFVGDGNNADTGSGALAYRGVAFDYAINAQQKPSADHEIFCDTDLSATRSAISLRLGAAVASGQRVPAVIKTLLLLGESLGTGMDAKAAFWQPASVVSGFSYYAETVRQYDDGAAFPCLVSIAFDTSTDENIRTQGLAWLSGQELVFERDHLPVHEAMRYVVRLVHDIATNGAVESIMDVPGMNHSERLILTPDAAKSALLVRRKHVQNGVNPAG